MSGAGGGRQLLAPEANESIISAYLHVCRQLTRQWATNIVFVEQRSDVSHKVFSHAVPDDLLDHIDKPLRAEEHRVAENADH